MVVILFRSKLTSAAGQDYSDKLAEMKQYAVTQPGFVDIKSFTAEDGERCTVVWWQNRETLEQWRRNLRHIEAKQAGRDRWYQYYDMEVAEVYRTSDFTRPGAEADSKCAEPALASW